MLNECILAPLLACGLCRRGAMLHPVVADCGHAIGCLACVEAYFDEHISENVKKRKATRIECKQCGAGFAKPRATATAANSKKKRPRYCVDLTLDAVARALRPDDFGEDRPRNGAEALAEAVDALKRQVRESMPIAGITNQEAYRTKVFDFLDKHVSDLGDLKRCKCKCGLVAYPKLSVAKNRWYISCPRWRRGGSGGGGGEAKKEKKEEEEEEEKGASCSFFQWVGSKDVERMGLV